MIYFMNLQPDTAYCKHFLKIHSWWRDICYTENMFFTHIIILSSYKNFEDIDMDSKLHLC